MGKLRNWFNGMVKGLRKTAKVLARKKEYKIECLLRNGKIISIYTDDPDIVKGDEVALRKFCGKYSLIEEI